MADVRFPGMALFLTPVGTHPYSVRIACRQPCAPVSCPKFVCLYGYGIVPGGHSGRSTNFMPVGEKL
ncbi:hypothetical protein RA2_01080 [Roseovarius sp. A-2]|nr:hypothetical protein RA2_01080 [Roseovarius sp. A-2]